MKRISYSLYFGLVGSKNSGKEIFIEYLNNLAIESNPPNDKENTKRQFEFFIVFEQIPIKIRGFLADNLDQIVYNHKNIKNLDVIMLVLNLYDLESINEYDKNKYEEFIDYFQFKGLSILATVDIVKIFGGFSSKDLRISRDNVVEKAKQLDVIYCYEIQNKNEDLLHFYNKIFSDFLFKFQFSSPELFALAKLYGKELMEEKLSKKI